MDQIPPFLQFYPDGPLNTSDSYSEAPNSALSNPNQVDVDSQFLPDYLVWERPLSPCSPAPESNPAQSHNMQSMPHAFSDNYDLHRGFSGSNMQVPQQCDLTAVSNANLRSHSASQPGPLAHCQCIENASLQQARLSLMDRGYLFLETPDFFMPDSSNANFRDGNGVPVQHAPFLCHSNPALCPMSQGLDVDDAVSNAYTQPSCNSKCTSTVCENDNCSVNGVPCDDPACFEEMYQTTMPDLTGRASMQMPSAAMHFSQSHSQPCNHTESEHLVARTLGELRAPPGTQSQGQTPPPVNPDFVVSRVGGQFYNDSPPSFSSPFQASIESVGSDPSEPQTPIAANSATRHICRWITNPGAPEGERKLCGMEFTDTQHFQNHLCEAHSIKTAGQTGFPCLWDGCHRKQDCPFVTRGKLCRHLSTHSGYKPFTCNTCGQHFSGQQALAQHERIHTGLKPYRCTYPGCTMSFKQKSALTMHSRVHTGEKPLSCDICGKPFAESSNLAKHRKTHLGKLDHRCQYMVNGKPCGKAFLRLDQLRRHQRCHLNHEKRRTGHSRKMSAMSSSTTEDIPHTDQSPSISFDDIMP